MKLKSKRGPIDACTAKLNEILFLSPVVAPASFTFDVYKFLEDVYYQNLKGVPYWKGPMLYICGNLIITAG